MAQKTIDEMKKKQEEHFNAHRMFFKAVFEKSNDMDFFFQWLLGSQTNGGCSSGEIFYAASQIEDGNPESWEKTFAELAERVESRAEASLKKGHSISAREAYLRACNYYRAPLFIMRPQNPNLRKLAARLRSCFHKAALLFDPPVEPFEIPFEGKSLPGYFWKAANDGKPHKTLLMIGGGETFAEDLYFYIAPHARKRGYNFVTVDLPGQGPTPFDNLFFRPDTEVPIGKVLDYITARPEVDADRIAAYGVSLGGYYVPRAACYDKRIKACIANSLLSDLEEIVASAIKGGVADAIYGDPIQARVSELIAWRWGFSISIDDPAFVDALIEENKAFKFDCTRITCPLLVVVGEGEYQNKVLQKQTQNGIKHTANLQKELAILPMNEGAGHHCQAENTPLMAQVVFDWLDELFEIS